MGWVVSSLLTLVAVVFYLLWRQARYEAQMERFRYKAAEHAARHLEYVAEYRQKELIREREEKARLLDLHSLVDAINGLSQDSGRTDDLSK